MRLLLSTLAVSGLLIGCSNGGSSTPAPNPYKVNEDFKPNEVPANAASDADAKEVLLKIRDRENVLPADAAIFDNLIEGSESQSTGDNSQKRQEALAKLDANGKSLLGDIRSHCMVRNPVLTKLGAPAKDSSVTEAYSMETLGTDCPYLISEKSESKTTYSVFDINQSNGNVHVVANGSSTDKKSREIRDPRIVSVTGVKKVASALTTTSKFEVSASQGSSNSKGIVNAAGTLEFTFANGEVLVGSIKMVMAQDDESKETQASMELPSSAGMVRIVMIQKPSQEKPDIYLNGKPIDPELLKQMQGFFNTGN